MLSGGLAMPNSDPLAKKYEDYATRQGVIQEIEKSLDADWEEGMRKLRTYDAIDSEDLGRDLYALAWAPGNVSEKHRQIVKQWRRF